MEKHLFKKTYKREQQASVTSEPQATPIHTPQLMVTEVLCQMGTAEASLPCIGPQFHTERGRLLASLAASLSPCSVL